jgi:hypothetical protein
MVWRRDRINVCSVMYVMITDLTLTTGVRRLGPVPVLPRYLAPVLTSTFCGVGFESAL